jgi:hypothetical protein
MHYENGFQHPDTGVFVRVVYAFGKLNIEVEDLEDILQSVTNDEDGSHAQSLTEAHAETVELVKPFKGRRCHSLAEATQVCKRIARDQWDWGFERVE